MFRIFRRLLVGLFVLGLGGIAFLWLEHRSATELPALTGPYRVARIVYDWTDPASGHELIVWVWYPCEPASGAPAAPYLPAAWRKAIEQDRGIVNARLLTRDLGRVHAHSYDSAPISTREPSYPLVIFRGGASAEVFNYTSLTEDLASHGYVVAAADAAYRTHVVVNSAGRVFYRLPENNPELGSPVEKVLAAWTADIGFQLQKMTVLNSTSAAPFNGRIDMRMVGMFGHSFGGSQSAEFCHSDARCIAAIDVDGALFGHVVQDGFHKPFLFLMSDHSSESGAEKDKIMADIQSVYDRLPSDTRQRVVIPGANHYMFSDDIALLKSRALVGVLRLCGLIRIDGRRQIGLARQYVHTFFDRYVKGASDKARM